MPPTAKKPPATVRVKIRELSWSLRIAFAATGLVAVCTFALSAYGLYGYGVDGLRIGNWSVLIPVGVDLLALCGMFAAYVTRTARLRVRVYSWAVFVVAVTGSIAGNWADGIIRELEMAGLIGSAMPPVMLALSVHLLVVTVRYVENSYVAAAADVATYEAASDAAGDVTVIRPSDVPAGFVVYRMYGLKGELIYVGCTNNLARRVREHRCKSPWWPEVTSMAYDPAESQEDALKAECFLIKTEHPTHNIQHAEPPKAPRPPASKPHAAQSRKPRPSAGRPASPDRDRAVAAVLAGESVVDVAKSVRRSPRAVQKWVRDHKQQQAAASDVFSASANGHRPDVDVAP